MTNECLRRIQERQSVRRYSSKPISDEHINDILSTGFSAPSAGNRQPWRIVTVTRQDLKDRLAQAAGGQKFLAGAPVVLVVCAVPEESAERYGKRGFTLYVLQDTAALTQNLLLAVHLLGYASCWIGAFDEEQVRDILHVPQSIRPVAIIPIGKSNGKSPPKPIRKSKQQTVVRESF